MAQQKTSFFEDVMQLGIKLPWWISATLAVALYFLFHNFSEISIPKVIGPNNINGPIIWSTIKTGSTIAQYLIPALLSIGALVGLSRNVTRKLTYESVLADTSGNKLASLSWAQFEDLVRQYFLERGFKVTKTKKGPDGGVDLRLAVKDGRAATVQCKHWRNKKVGVSIVREQYGIMMAEKADQCLVVTSGEFTQEAQDWVGDKPIGLIDGEQLQYLLGHIEFDHFPRKEANGLATAMPSPCPSCGSEMVLRTAKRGKNPGAKFWGCSTFPKCRMTVDGGR